MITNMSPEDGTPTQHDSQNVQGTANNAEPEVVDEVPEEPSAVAPDPVREPEEPEEPKEVE